VEEGSRRDGGGWRRSGARLIAIAIDRVKIKPGAARTSELLSISLLQATSDCTGMTY